MTTKLYGLGDVAKLLDVRAWKIARLFDEHRIDEPPRVAGRRVFAIAEIRQIAVLLGIDTPVIPRSASGEGEDAETVRSVS